MKYIYKTEGFNGAPELDSHHTEYIVADSMSQVVNHYGHTNLKSIECLGEYKKASETDKDKNAPQLKMLVVRIEAKHGESARVGQMFTFNDEAYKIEFIRQEQISDFLQSQRYHELSLVPL